MQKNNATNFQSTAQIRKNTTPRRFVAEQRTAESVSQKKLPDHKSDKRAVKCDITSFSQVCAHVGATHSPQLLRLMRSSTAHLGENHLFIAAQRIRVSTANFQVRQHLQQCEYGVKKTEKRNQAKGKATTSGSKPQQCNSCLPCEHSFCPADYLAS